MLILLSINISTYHRYFIRRYHEYFMLYIDDLHLANSIFLSFSAFNNASNRFDDHHRSNIAEKPKNKCKIMYLAVWKHRDQPDKKGASKQIKIKQNGVCVWVAVAVHMCFSFLLLLQRRLRCVVRWIRTKISCANKISLRQYNRKKRKEWERGRESEKAARWLQNGSGCIHFQYNHVNPDPKIVRFAVVFHYNNRCVLCIMWFEYFLFIYISGSLVIVFNSNFFFAAASICACSLLLLLLLFLSFCCFEHFFHIYCWELRAAG